MIAIPIVDLARKVVDIDNCSGDAVDKFKPFRLIPKPAKDVTAPLIGQWLANIECRVADRSMIECKNLFILEAVRIWVAPERKERRTLHHRGNGTFAVDGKIIDLRERMLLWKQFQD